MQTSAKVCCACSVFRCRPPRSPSGAARQRTARPPLRGGSPFRAQGPLAGMRALQLARRCSLPEGAKAPGRAFYPSRGRKGLLQNPGRLKKTCENHNHRPCRWFALPPWGMFLAEPIGSSKVLPTAPFSPATPKGVSYLLSCVGLPVNGSTYSCRLIWSSA